MVDEPLSPKFTAALDLLRRTGVSAVQVRYSDDEDPTVWFVVAIYETERYEVAAELHPELAALRLCEQLVDGGTCVHCQRPTVFHAGHTDSLGDLMEAATCSYRWDPELATFRRACEGRT